MSDNISNNNIENEGENESSFLNEIFLSTKIKDKDKYNFFEYISIMLNSGVGLTTALEGVTEKLDNIFFKQKINEMIVFINSGDSLSKAMKKLPQIFSKHEISIVEAGEKSGNLDNALESLAESIKKLDSLKKKIKSSLTYPFIIFIFLIIAVVITLVYVIPALMPLFEGTDTQLPAATRALLSTSNFVQNNWTFMLFVLISIIIGVMIYNSTDSGKAKINNLILSTPLIGNVYRNYIISNISSTMGNLIGAGVSMLNTLRLVGKSSNSFIYEKLFEEIIEKVKLGNKLVESIREVDPDKFYFPNSYLQMLSVGEKTANMQEINKKISNQYTREVDYSLANLTKWIEPIAIIIASGFVLWFAFAIFGAILQVTQSIG